MGSQGAAITAPAGRGDSFANGNEDYRIVLPQMPSGEAMRHAVVLHGDAACRPYRIEDFRKPLGDAGVLEEVVMMGAYQMSHVWLLDLRTDEAKKKLLEACRQGKEVPRRQSRRLPRLRPHRLMSSSSRRPQRGATWLERPRFLTRSPPSQRWMSKRAQRSARSKTSGTRPGRNYSCAGSSASGRWSPAGRA